MIKQNNYFVKKQVKVEFSVTEHADFGAVDAGELKVGSYGLGVYLPDNAIITNCFYDVITTFTTAGTDAGTLSLDANTAGDLKAAIAVSNASNVYDAGLHACLPGNYALDGNALTAIAMAAAEASSFIKLTAERELTVRLATQDFTAGKMIIYLEYVVSE